MKYLAITLDVEPDCTWPIWDYSDPLTFSGVSIGLKERLAPLLDKHGARPTYLINNVVLEHQPSVDILARMKNCELGAHLHPEFIEPQKLHSDYAGKKNEGNQCFLPEDIEFEKMRALTELFKKSFGYYPASFRAGRFSARGNTISALERLGYKIDTSVTPHVVWADATRERPVDFSTAPEQPYFASSENICRPSPESRLLEVPITIIQVRRFFRRRELWLRPKYSSPQELLRIIDSLSAKDDNCVLNMMFHNVELVPGKSPYNRTEEDCRQHLDAIEGVVRHCLEKGFRCATLSEIYDTFSP